MVNITRAGDVRGVRPTERRPLGFLSQFFFAGTERDDAQYFVERRCALGNLECAGEAQRPHTVTRGFATKRQILHAGFDQFTQRFRHGHDFIDTFTPLESCPATFVAANGFVKVFGHIQRVRTEQ